MSQDTSENEKRKGTRGSANMPALIGGAAVILAAIIGGIFALAAAHTGKGSSSGATSPKITLPSSPSVTPTSSAQGILSDPSSQGVRSVAFSHDGKFVATADANGNTYVWATPADTIANTLQAPTSMGVNTVAFSETGKLATGNGNGLVYLWAGAHYYAHFTDPASKGITAIAFTPNGRRLAAADGNGHTYMWDVATGKIVGILSDPSSQGVRSVAFSYDGKFVATADANGNTYIVNLSRLGA